MPVIRTLWINSGYRHLEKESLPNNTVLKIITDIWMKRQLIEVIALGQVELKINIMSAEIPEVAQGQGLNRPYLHSGHVVCIR